MTPVDQLRLEKAATDCGFEMTPVVRADCLELRSARFADRVRVRVAGALVFQVMVENPQLLEAGDGSTTATVEGYQALYEVLRTAAALARTLPNRVADRFRAQTAALPRLTEAERSTVQRIGQDLFRAALLDYWRGRCCVTGLDLPPLLRASHIKPWAACDSDDERLDVFNGLLLAPHIDALFDGGWISFQDDGQLLMADALPVDAARRLGVTGQCGVASLKPEHRRYLAFHRQQVLRKGA